VLLLPFAVLRLASKQSTFGSQRVAVTLVCRRLLLLLLLLLVFCAVAAVCCVAASQQAVDLRWPARRRHSGVLSFAVVFCLLFLLLLFVVFVLRLANKQSAFGASALPSLWCVAAAAAVVVVVVCCCCCLLLLAVVVVCCCLLLLLLLLLQLLLFYAFAELRTAGKQSTFGGQSVAVPLV
jgi:hypothetical protein